MDDLLSTTKHEVSVLFESHCPDSRNFIHNDLVPVFHKLEKYVSLRLVPFGKAQSLQGGGFTCQHGPKECRGNMIMSCAFARLSPGRNQLNMASCFMADPDDGGQRCCEESGVRWRDVEECMVSREGEQLQKQAEVESYAIRQSRFVPTIILNKTYRQDFQNDAVNGRFKSNMCQHLGLTDC